MPQADSRSRLTAEQVAELLDIAAVVVAIALLLMVLANKTGILRILLTAAFTFFVPGRAIVSNWRRMAGWANVATSVVLSLGSLALLALITLWLRVWNPESLFAVESLLSLMGLAIALSRRRRSDPM